MLLSVLTELAAFLLVILVAPGLLWLAFDVWVEGEK
jgi:hypothetical protein